MARFDGGWIRIDRRVVFGDISDNPIRFCVWNTILHWSNYMESTVKIGSREVKLNPGQLCTSHDEIADKWGFNRNQVRRALNYLEKTGRIMMRKTTQGTLIDVVNFQTFQELGGEHKESTKRAEREQKESTPKTTKVIEFNNIIDVENISNDPQREHKESRKRAVPSPLLNNRQETTNKKQEGEDNNSKGFRERKPRELTPHDLDLGKRWADHAYAEWPHLKPNATKYAESISLVKKRTGMNDKQMDYVFDFVRNDEFWSPNCQSPGGLLKKSKNDVRKIDNILAKIKRDKYSHLKVLEYAKAYDEGKVTREDLNRGCAF